MFEVLKRVLVFQDVLSWCYSKVPVILEHNLAKYNALKRAFYLTSLEKLEGDYHEFGVFTGSSFVFAMRVYRRFRYLGDQNVHFYGYDSFVGFGDVTEDDKHHFYENNLFTVNRDKILRHIDRRAKNVRYDIIEGYFEDTLKGKSCSNISARKVNIAFIDCDMKSPARDALEYIWEGLQIGSIIIFDDFFSYRGIEELGVTGAFAEFQAAHPELRFRDLFTYGALGKAFIVCDARPALVDGANVPDE